MKPRYVVDIVFSIDIWKSDIKRVLELQRI